MKAFLSLAIISLTALAFTQPARAEIIRKTIYHDSHGRAVSGYVYQSGGHCRTAPVYSYRYQGPSARNYYPYSSGCYTTSGYAGYYHGGRAYSSHTYYSAPRVIYSRARSYRPSIVYSRSGYGRCR